MADKKKTKDEKITEFDRVQGATEATAEAEARSTILEIIELAGTHTTATDTEAIETKVIDATPVDNRKHVSFKDTKVELKMEEKNDEKVVKKKDVKKEEGEKMEEKRLETKHENQAEQKKETQKVTKKPTKDLQDEQRWELVVKSDKVKDFVKVLESNQERNIAQCVDTLQQLAKKRKMNANKREPEHNASVNQDDTAKRKRGDIENLSLDDIIIEDLPETQENYESDAEEQNLQQQQQQQQVDKQQTANSPKQFTCTDDDLPISENQEIAERFKQIMEMFDNFTKNLESLEMSSTSEDNGPLREPSPQLSAVMSGMELRMNEGFVASIGDEELLTESSTKQEKNNDYIIDIEDIKRPETEIFELSQLQQSTDNMLPKWRQGLQRSPLMSSSMRNCKDTSTSTQLELRTAAIASVSCQTSLYNHGQRPNDAAAAQNVEDVYAHEHPLSFPAVSVVLPPRSFVKKTNSTPQQYEQQDNDCRVETYMAMPPQSDTADSKNPSPRGPNIGPSISLQNLVKVSESPSVLELPVITQPYSAERNFHTIHIDTTSSPSSSVMRRPPLGVRCWHVLTDLFNAICMCLQVNKDCIFCIGFFIAFVVSASFLTAFFYRTLSITPQFFHPTSPSAMQQTGTGFRDTGFYYY